MPKPKNPARLTAEAAGEMTYVGPPCHLGHVVKYVRNAGCVECALARAQARDQVTVKAYKASYYDRNADRLRAESAQWRSENPDRFKAALRAWTRNNPDKARQGRRRRRARKRGASGSHTIAEIRAILVRQNGTCAYCDCDNGLHLDHRIPLSRGGSDAAINLQWLCAWHNLSKGVRTDLEYREMLGIAPHETDIVLAFCTLAPLLSV